MTHSAQRTDQRSSRSARVKIVAIGLVFATLIAGAGIAARIDHGDGAKAAHHGGQIIRGAQPLSASGQPPVLW